MKNQFNQYRQYIIVIFLLLGPLLDVANFLGSSVSVIIRGLFLIAITLHLIVQKEERKILFPLFIFAIGSILYQYLYLNMSMIATISATLKFLYLPISLMYLKSYIFPVDKDWIVTIILATYIVIYLFSYIFGLGAEVYAEAVQKTGFKGLFNSINEFSAILVCLLPIASVYLKENKKYILLGFLWITALFCSLLIGTKVLLGGILISVFYILWQERERLFLKKTKSGKIAIIIGTVFLLFVGGFLFTKTRTYQNMKVQQNFFKVENVLSLEFVNKVVYNNRLTFLKDSIQYMEQVSPIEWFLGIGTENDLKLVEIDIFDIVVRYGIIGFFVFFGATICLIEWKNLRECEKVSVLLMLFISITSGHVLIYPAVSIYLGVICSKSARSHIVETTTV